MIYGWTKNNKITRDEIDFVFSVLKSLYLIAMSVQIKKHKIIKIKGKIAIISILM
jgi:hypothetical protein